MTKDKTQTQMAAGRTDLAVERTAMAADRTLMAWTRTSLSMISFGFSIFKFMQYMQEEGTALLKSHHGPRNFGMALITIGVICLIIACVQHWQFEKKNDSGWKWYSSLTFLAASFIAILGILSLMNALFKIGPF